MAINKAAMSYRQEKSRKLSSIDCSMTEPSTLQQDDRMAHAFMDAHGCAARSKTARSRGGAVPPPPVLHALFIGVSLCSQMSSAAPSTSPAASWGARRTATVGGRARRTTRVSSTRPSGSPTSCSTSTR